MYKLKSHADKCSVMLLLSDVFFYSNIPIPSTNIFLNALFSSHCYFSPSYSKIFSIALSQETRRLMRLYGKNQPSNAKMNAYELLKSGLNYKEIAARLRVQEPTAEVYTIDALAAGAPLDHERMAILLGVAGDTFEAIKKAISSNTDSKLRSIKDELNESLTYNQIRFVLACMIRDINL